MFLSPPSLGTHLEQSGPNNCREREQVCVWGWAGGRWKSGDISLAQWERERKRQRDRACILLFSSVQYVLALQKKIKKDLPYCTTLLPELGITGW